jgi:hypothetical protein
LVRIGRALTGARVPKLNDVFSHNKDMNVSADKVERKRSRYAVYVVYFLFFWLLYFGWGMVIGKAGGYTYLNALFNADHSRVIGDMTAVAVYHGRTDVHPLFVLIFNPVGLVLRRLTGSPLITAVSVNSLAGALGVVGALAFFRRAGLGPAFAGIFAAVLGFSSTHLLFGATPETWIFAAAAVILLYLLSLSRGGRLLYFIPAGVFATGMVTTNLAHAVIAYVAGLARKVGAGRTALLAAIFGASVAAFTALLSLVQKLIYPGTTLFFLPDVYRQEFGTYAPVVAGIGDLTFIGVLSRVGKLVTHLFIFNVIAPGTLVRWFSAGEYCLPLKPFVDLDTGTPGPLGTAGAVLWVLLIIGGVYAAARNRGVREPVFWGLATSILFNIIFYFFYGSAIFIYSISSTFPLIAAVALALRPYARKGSGRCRELYGFLILFLIVEITNNINLLYRTLDAFRDYPYPLAP